MTIESFTAVWCHRIHLWSPRDNKTLCGRSAQKWDALPIDYWGRHSSLQCRMCELALKKRQGQTRRPPHNQPADAVPPAGVDDFTAGIW